MNIHKYLSICLFFVCLIHGKPVNAFGLTDWSEKTPHGNSITNVYGGKSLWMPVDSHIFDLSEWYFYDYHIVGKTTWGGYFVVNELNHNVYMFGTANEWKRFIDEKDLEPLVWTRWHSGDWTFFDMRSFGLLMFYLGLPLLLIALGLFLLWPRLRSKTAGSNEDPMNKEKSGKTKKTKRRVYLWIGILFLVIWLLDQYPQSF